MWLESLPVMGHAPPGAWCLVPGAWCLVDLYISILGMAMFGAGFGREPSGMGSGSAWFGRFHLFAAARQVSGGRPGRTLISHPGGEDCVVDQRVQSDSEADEAPLNLSSFATNIDMPQPCWA
jgi:hypothetical protein